MLGSVPLDSRTKSGWTTPFKFWAFRCPEHGLVESRPYGYDKYLRCPECDQEDSQ